MFYRKLVKNSSLSNCKVQDRDCITGIKCIKLYVLSVNQRKLLMLYFRPGMKQWLVAVSRSTPEHYSKTN